MLKTILIYSLLLSITPAAFARSFRCEDHADKIGVTVFASTPKRIMVSLAPKDNYFLARRGINQYGSSYRNGQLTVFVPRSCLANATKNCKISINLDADDSTPMPYSCSVVR